MSKIIKKSVSVLLILTMLFSVFAINAVGAEVEEDYGIMPCWSTISTISTSFVISGINSTSTVLLCSQYEASLHIKIELQKLSSGTYKTIETWTKTTTDTSVVLEKTRLINAFCDYRIKVTCIAGSETHVTYDYP